MDPSIFKLLEEDEVRFLISLVSKIPASVQIFCLIDGLLGGWSVVGDFDFRRILCVIRMNRCIRELTLTRSRLL